MIRPIIRKVDDNRAEIVAAFRRLRWSVRSTAIIGKGFPDVAVGKFGVTFFVEVKDGKKRPTESDLTEDEEKFWREGGGSLLLIESVDDVIEFNRKRSARHP